MSVIHKMTASPGCAILRVGTLFRLMGQPGGLAMPEDDLHQAPPQTTVRAVDRALDVLLCFSKSDDGLSLSDIARAVNLHKSTVHRLLASLQAKGFVRKYPHSDRYCLGWSVLELMSGIYQSDELSSVVLPEMTHLRDETGETVVLYVRSGHERIRIQTVETNKPSRQPLNIGRTYPLFVGASGKVLLAYSDAVLISEVMTDPRFAKHMDKEAFLNQLRRVKERGYATSLRERDADSAAIAVPVFGRHNFLAALSVTGPAVRLTPETLESMRETLLQSARLITGLLSR